MTPEKETEYRRWLKNLIGALEDLLFVAPNARELREIMGLDDKEMGKDPEKFIADAQLLLKFAKSNLAKHDAA